MTRRYDDPESGPFGLCNHEHATREEAELCPDIPAEYRRGAKEEDDLTSDLVDAINAAVINGEGEIIETYLRDALKKVGLRVVRA